MESLFHVDGKPFFSIGGQVNNSSSHSPKTLEKAINAISHFRMNTIAVPLYWYQFEPEENVFSYDQIDFILDAVRPHHLKVVFLWFGSWKNGTSQYIPLWMKKDKHRFTWVHDASGGTARILSPLCQETLRVEKAAFERVMSHIKQVNLDGTVLGIQVENEPGQLGTPRDYSEKASSLFSRNVPAPLIELLKSLSGGQLLACWNDNGRKTDANWKRTFGLCAEEVFSAYCFSQYVNEIASAGKQIYALPMYVNVWLRETQNRLPGIDYPAGGATSLVLDVWKKFAPMIDAVCPDVYFEDFATYDDVCANYKRDDNILYIPESHADDLNALYVFSMIEHHALSGIHCFAIDSTIDNQGDLLPQCENFRHAVYVLSSMKPLLERYVGTKNVHAVAQYEGMESQFIDFGDFFGRVYFLNSIHDEEYLHLDTYHDEPQNIAVRGKGLIVYAGHGEFYLAGDGFKLVLLKKDSTEHMTSSLRASKYLNARNAEIVSVEEGTFDEQGEFIVNKVRCGDESDVGLWVSYDVGLVHATFETGESEIS